MIILFMTAADAPGGSRASLSSSLSISGRSARTAWFPGKCPRLNARIELVAESVSPGLRAGERSPSALSREHPGGGDTMSQPVSPARAKEALGMLRSAMGTRPPRMPPRWRP